MNFKRNMEPETRAFLIKIANTLFMFLFWMMINSTAGIYFGYAFPEGGISIGNIIFYIFCIGSFMLLIRYYLRIWKEKEENISE